MKHLFMRYTFFLAAFICCTVASAKSMLWKVSSKSTTIYLQGSIHVLKAKHYPLASESEEAFSKSKIIGFETDLDKLNSTEAQMLIMQKAMLKNGKTLSTELSPKIYKLVGKKADELGLQLAMFERFKPWMVNLTLTMTKYQTLGFKAEHGVDQYFFKKAKAKGRKIVGLETINQQFEAIDSLSEHDSDEMTLQTINELDNMGKDVNKMITAWKTGDVSAIDNLFNNEFRKFPKAYNALLVDRNNKWVKKLRRYLAGKQTCMFVVGTAHLAGKDSVITKLEKLGYKVTQL